MAMPVASRFSGAVLLAGKLIIGLVFRKGQRGALATLV